MKKLHLLTWLRFGIEMYICYYYFLNVCSSLSGTILEKAVACVPWNQADFTRHQCTARYKPHITLRGGSGGSAVLRLFWPMSQTAGDFQVLLQAQDWQGTYNQLWLSETGLVPLGRQSASGQLKLFGFEIYSGVLPNTQKR